MNKLLPCPFCGSDNIQFVLYGYFQPWKNDGINLWYHCQCHDCGCEIDTGDCKDMKKAIIVWNQRKITEEDGE